jgi:hypothetical protein
MRRTPYTIPHHTTFALHTPHYTRPVHSRTSNVSASPCVTFRLKICALGQVWYSLGVGYPDALRKDWRPGGGVDRGGGGGRPGKVRSEEKEREREVIGKLMNDGAGAGGDGVSL